MLRTSSLDTRHLVAVEPAFPLTLTLSLGERELPAPGACSAHTGLANSAANMARRRRTILPLPEGEYVFSVVAAQAKERGLQSAGVLVSEGGFGILRTRLCSAHVPAG